MDAKKEKPVSIPNGFKCSDKGVIFIKEDKDGSKTDQPVTFKEIKVTALSRDGLSDNWGRLVIWKDHDDKKHEMAIPSAMFHATGNDLAQKLADGGLPIVPGCERHLLRYLTAFIPHDRLIAATSTGWHGDAFVLPLETINEPEGERIVFQPAGLSNTSKAIHRKGTLSGWQAAVKNAPPIAIFFTCSSLSAPLRFPCEIEAGGFHSYWRTSRGKTSTLQCGASVWGDGIDPQLAGGREAVIQRWNSTSNALEAKAEAFNDLPLIVDEIGEGDGKTFGQTIYRILSGTGRGRAKRDGTLADSKTWRTMILSAGELPVSQYIQEGGSKVRGGQLVRLVDIPDEHGFKSATEADFIKNQCAVHFGHAGPALIEGGDLLSGWENFDHEQIGIAITPESGRVRKRFALAAYAGTLGIERGILPWTVEQVVEAVRLAYQGWLNNSDGVSDVERGVENIVEFLLEHGDSRFDHGRVNSAGDPVVVRDRAGWYRDGRYHFTRKAFKEACNGAPDKDTRKALHDKGWLHTNSTKHLTSTIRVDGQSTRVISVKQCVLADTTDTTSESEVVSPETPTGQGPTPPTPPTPPQKGSPDKIQDHPTTVRF